MRTGSTRTRMDDQRKDHFNPEGLPQRNPSKQLQTYDLLTDDVENINSTNKVRDLLLANKRLRNRKDAAKDPEAQQSYFA